MPAWTTNAHRMAVFVSRVQPDRIARDGCRDSGPITALSRAVLYVQHVQLSSSPTDRHCQKRTVRQMEQTGSAGPSNPHRPSRSHRYTDCLVKLPRNRAGWLLDQSNPSEIVMPQGPSSNKAANRALTMVCTTPFNQPILSVSALGSLTTIGGIGRSSIAFCVLCHATELCVNSVSCPRSLSGMGCASPYARPERVKLDKTHAIQDRPQC
ncbi:hypothetical protein VTN02DRAFT_3805 [Thermoascus thermophilus]